MKRPSTFKKELLNLNKELNELQKKAKTLMFELMENDKYSEMIYTLEDLVDFDLEDSIVATFGE